MISTRSVNRIIIHFSWTRFPGWTSHCSVQYTDHVRWSSIILKSGYMSIDTVFVVQCNMFGMLNHTVPRMSPIESLKNVLFIPFPVPQSMHCHHLTWLQATKWSHIETIMHRWSFFFTTNTLYTTVIQTWDVFQKQVSYYIIHKEKRTSTQAWQKNYTTTLWSIKQ